MCLCIFMKVGGNLSTCSVFLFLKKDPATQHLLTLDVAIKYVVNYISRCNINFSMLFLHVNLFFSPNNIFCYQASILHVVKCEELPWLLRRSVAKVEWVITALSLFFTTTYTNV